jgi:hypothetical protein
MQVKKGPCIAITKRYNETEPMQGQTRGDKTITKTGVKLSKFANATANRYKYIVCAAQRQVLEVMTTNRSDYYQISGVVLKLSRDSSLCA